MIPVTTSVFLSITSEAIRRQQLEERLTSWGFSVIPFTDTDAAWAILTDEHPPELFFFEWTEQLSESNLFLQAIWDTRHEFPFHALVFGDQENQNHLLKALGQGAHDFLTSPFDEALLKAKLEVARQIVVDRRVLAESAQVMERYARHVDRLSAERARQLFHAERLSTLGTMSAGLAHEIKNPLGYISTSLETTKIYWEQTSKLLSGDNAEETLDDETKARILDRVPKALDRISNGLERIDKLMQGLKNFARSSRGSKKFYSLNASVETALEMCAANLKYGIEVVTTLQEEIPFVRVEPQQVEQVLINLFVNASHALEGQEGAKIFVRTWADSEWVTVTVSDNGPGIPRSKLNTIWEPYYTTKEEGKGTGLGLAISKSLIRDNGGKITVQNRDEGGAEFTIQFPVLAQEESDSEEQ
ncbi:MAG: hypothetical protein KDD70_00195 [Bdellovibrionales bacterium]|nr:hypothetical protein [Bdellovibrionales bacterium]